MQISTNVIEKLKESYDTLTDGGKKICDFVTGNPEVVQYYSITELSEACNVGDATITRFCRRIGFNNFNEFKVSLAKSITATSVKVQIEEQNSLEKVQIEDDWDVGKNQYLQHIDTITQTMNLMDRNSINEAVSMLSKAEKVICMGQGTSAVLAMEMWTRFATISSKFECVQDVVFQLISLSQANEDDVMVYISYSGATKECMEAMKIAKEKKVKVILITRHKRCPAAQYADVILICGAPETPFEQGSILTRVSILLIIDILYNEFFATDIEKYSKLLEISALTTLHRMD